MAVALVVVAVPVLTVLFNREVRALQQRVADLERRLEAAFQAPAPVAPVAPAAAPGPELLDLLRTLSALRPTEPEFVEEYYVEADRD